MTNLDTEISTLIAMLNEFKSFVISDQVFWPISGHGPVSNRFGQLSLGGILTLDARLTGLAADQPQVIELHKQREALFNQWYSNVQRKALAEAKSRLNSWRWYLEDCGDNLRKCGDLYHSEVYPRVFLAMIFSVLDGAKGASSLRQRLHKYDGQLRQMWRPGEFVWEPELSANFDKTNFWFLYGRPGIA